ncbi:MAG: flagellar FlbD family protein [Actinomycetaceae bacterium]|nr:flagellar FlbD family protein [Actinomycetaceae bacterium]
MITLKRLGGAEFALNPDLIERIEVSPDTILVLVDGARYIVLESLEQVISKIVDSRARVLARAEQIAATPEARKAPVVPLKVYGEE